MPVPIFKAGQIHCGLKSTYRLLKPCHARSSFVWEAVTFDADRTTTRVVIKNGDHGYLLREDDILTKLKGKPGVRQMVDTITSPPSLVLEHYEDDLRTVTLRQKLQEADIKFIAFRLLQALSAAHEAGIVHSDIKPQNILVSGFGINKKNFRLNFISNMALGEKKSNKKKEVSLPIQRAVLADWAQAASPGGYPISPMSFRAPEVWLQQKWSFPADIWSFGVVVASLLMQFGNEIFRVGDRGDGAKVSDILTEMHCVLGPMPDHMIPPELKVKFETALKSDTVGRNWVIIASQCGVSKAATQFVQDILILDPNERPTAAHLLQHSWLANIRA